MVTIVCQEKKRKLLKQKETMTQNKIIKMIFELYFFNRKYNVETHHQSKEITSWTYSQEIVL